MKIQRSSMVGWRAVWLLAGCLTVLSQAANAQVGGGRGSGPQRSIGIVIGGPGGPVDIGATLLKTCDTNQDGAATPDEVKVSLLIWFRQVDADTNQAISEIELATGLKQLFPVPEPPPGIQAPPEEMALHNLLASKLTASVDVNQDGWIVFKEAIAFVGQSLPQWDSDSSGSISASEFAAALVQFMPGPTAVSGSHQLR
jgi:hypothetical protein